MEITEPFLGEATCARCGAEWDVLMPDGVLDSEAIECPECGEKTGRVRDG